MSLLYNFINSNTFYLNNSLSYLGYLHIIFQICFICSSWKFLLLIKKHSWVNLARRSNVQYPTKDNQNFLENHLPTMHKKELLTKQTDGLCLFLYGIDY